LHGTNLTAVTSVTFGGTTATFTITGPTAITVTVPSGTPTTVVGVTVTSPGGTSNSVTFTYTYPTVVLSRITPSSGQATGGTVVTLHGNNFTYITSVTFGGQVVTFTRTTSTTLHFTVPINSTPTRTVTVVVTWPTGGVSNAVTYHFNAPPPELTGITPTSGLATGGSTARLSGENLQYVTSVRFGGTTASFAITGPTAITVVVPPGPAGTPVTVTVTSSGGTSSSVSFLYTYPTPSITSITPPIGPSNGGTTVIIRGTHLQYVTEVTFGTTPATTFSIFGPTSLIVTVPPGTPTTTVSVNVTSPGGTSGSLKFHYTYPTPSLESITPSTGPAAGGNTVTIHGKNLQYVTTVYFATTTATIVTSTTTSITVKAPGGYGGSTVTVSVTSPVGRTFGVSYTYRVPPPTLTFVSPAYGPSTGGTTVTLYGTWLTSVTSVTFGGNAATISSVASTSIQVTVPPGTPTTTVTVTVTSPHGSSTCFDCFHYIYPTPTLSTITPGTGPATGGNTVTIRGTNLGYVTGVFFGTTRVTVTQATTTFVEVIAPPGTPGNNVTVSVTSPAGRKFGLSYTYTVAANPLTVTTTSLPNGTIGDFYITTVSASGGTGTYTWTMSTLPTGLNYTTFTGEIYGTPTVVGTFTVRITVRDGIGTTASTALALTITANPPTITTTSLPNGTIGDFYITTVSASGGTGTYTWTMSTLPTGLNYTTFTGEIYGTPTVVGTFTVRITVRDGYGTSASTALTLTITANPPTITTTSLPNGTIGDYYTTTVSASGGTGTYIWTMSTLPTGLNYTTFTGEIYGTPTVVGTFTVRITVRDGYGTTASTALTLTITANPPTITTTSLPSGTVGVPYTTTVSASGGTGTYTWTMSTLPTGLTYTTSTGEISGTPTQVGTFLVFITVRDGYGTTDSVTLNLKIFGT
jgi:hypothetical protein